MPNACLLLNKSAPIQRIQDLTLLVNDNCVRWMSSFILMQIKANVGRNKFFHFTIFKYIVWLIYLTSREREAKRALWKKKMSIVTEPNLPREIRLAFPTLTYNAKILIRFYWRTIYTCTWRETLPGLLMKTLI